MWESVFLCGTKLSLMIDKTSVFLTDNNGGSLSLLSSHITLDIKDAQLAGNLSTLHPTRCKAYKSLKPMFFVSNL
jgi:hypothetical protein